jgi:hypothetical protein
VSPSQGSPGVGLWDQGHGTACAEVRKTRAIKVQIISLTVVLVLEEDDDWKRNFFLETISNPMLSTQILIAKPSILILEKA